MSDQLTLSSAGFRAKTLAEQAGGQGLRVLDRAFGRISIDSSGKFGPPGYSLKTFGGSLNTGSYRSLVTLPAWGMMRNGALYPLVRLEPHIHVKDCSLLPTPRATDAIGGGKLGRKRNQWNMRDWARNTCGPGPLNPNLTRWLMGFPEGWIENEPTETP